MSKLISTLEQLQSLRQRAVNEIGARLNSQQQLCQRYEKNISSLTALAAGMSEATGCSPVMMANHSGYRRTIQRVIDWQKQEQALANLEAKKLQGELLQEAKREKSLEMVLEDRRRQHQTELNRRDQKHTDAISAQCWLRRKHAHR